MTTRPCSGPCPCSRAGPGAVVARTVKGYGVGFLEGDVMCHYRSFKPDQRDLLLGALEERRAA